MKKHEIFETNPNLKQVHLTSDGQAFYNDNDAKMHAKTLEDKNVELVINPSLIDTIAEDVDGDDEPKEEINKTIPFVPSADRMNLGDSGSKEDAPKHEADEAKAELEKSLAEFDPETTKYPEALKLFKALGLESENEKKDTIYPLLVAEKAKAQQGANTQE
ncbi:hypothetical protein [Flavobacterium gilvum]|uniref:Uncharacterized protein n=1 Tax=Flavobacterium gilvum TaxID=1492737 RepID=A0AAC9N6D3_9FLAO|nr:hypothetical protein [Flavobacterium gilvum]AOW08743.1 hypothetical protein EM308_04080 [Flavobacterium gilvum]KFC59816.1 hypothetical protein FEM08_13270 [Flavobacterium gilvum]